MVSVKTRDTNKGVVTTKMNLMQNINLLQENIDIVSVKHIKDGPISCTNKLFKQHNNFKRMSSRYNVSESSLLSPGIKIDMNEKYSKSSFLISLNATQLRLLQLKNIQIYIRHQLKLETCMSDLRTVKEMMPLT